MGALASFRQLMGRWGAQQESSGEQRGGGSEHPEQREQPASASQEREARLVRDELAARRLERGDESPPPTEPPSPRIARHVAAYLNARAEEALAQLLEELSRETTRELADVLEETRQTVSAEIHGVREGVHSSQRELSRVGRELVRSGATLESIQTAVSALGPALEQMAESLRGELAQEHSRERELREEAERAALDDMLATLDGLGAGLEHGRELVETLSEAQRRLEDTTVKRWWRAMGEATGVKRPLPAVPVADLEGWIAGLELTHRRMEDALARRGIAPIEAVGKPFDPYTHEAVAVEPCPPEQDGLVLREERRGYRTSDRVIRLAQVVVGRAAPAGDPPRRRRPGRTAGEHPTEDAEARPGHDPGQPDSPGEG